MAVSMFEIDFKTPANAPSTVPYQAPDPDMAEDGPLPTLSDDSSVLPTIGGVVGGVAGALKGLPVEKLAPVLDRFGVYGKVAGQALRLAPSAFGTALGTTVGTTAEQQLEGRETFSAQGWQEIVNNAATEVAWDVGGNLVIAAGGQVLKIPKAVTGKLQDTVTDARKAAQLFLAERGGTLTGGQLVGGFRGLLETFVQGPLTRKYFENQQTSVKEALSTAVQDLRNLVPGTPEFFAKLGQINTETLKNVVDRPELLNMTAENVGLRAFSESLKQAETALYTVGLPFYQALAARGKNIPIDITRLTELGTAAAAMAKKSAGFIDLSSKYAALSKLGGQGSEVTLDTLHSMRSQVARDLIDASNPLTSTKVKEGVKELRHMRSVIDKIINEHATKVIGSDKALLKEYTEQAAFYRQSQKDLWGESIKHSLLGAPEQLGKVIYDSTSLNGLSEVLKSAKKASELTAMEVATQEGLKRGTPVFKARVSQILKDPAKFGALSEDAILNNVRQGYISKFLSTPEGILKWADNLDKNAKQKAVARGLFGADQYKFMMSLKEAAQRGLVSTEAAQTVSRITVASTTAVGVAGAVAAANGLLVALSPDQQETVKDALGDAALVAGSLVLSQRGLARMLTDKVSSDALIKFWNLKSPMAGGAFAKTVLEPLTRAGAFDGLIDTQTKEVIQQNAPVGISPFNVKFQ